MRHITFIYTIFFFLCTAQIVTGQIGIGTTNPDASAILDISKTDQGLLIPQVLLDSTTDNLAIPTAANTLLVFNTNTANDIYPGYYYWDGTRWQRLLTGAEESIKCSNLDYQNGGSGLETDLNVSPGIKAPVFGTTEWNDDIFLYSANATNREITVLRSGTYQVTFNIIYYRAKSGIAVKGQFLINNSPVGSIAASGFIDGKSSDNEEASITLVETFDLNANDTISVQVSRDTNKSGGTYMTSVGTSTITVINLK